MYAIGAMLQSNFLGVSGYLTYLQVGEARQLGGVVLQRHVLVVPRRDAGSIVRHLDQLAAAFLEPHLRCVIDADCLSRSC